TNPPLLYQSFDLPQRFGVDVDRVDYSGLARPLGQWEQERPVAGTDVGNFLPRHDLQGLDDAGNRPIITRRRRCALLPQPPHRQAANEQNPYTNCHPFFGSHSIPPIPPSRRPTASVTLYSSCHLNSEYGSEFRAHYLATRLVAILVRIRGAEAGL